VAIAVPAEDSETQLGRYMCIVRIESNQNDKRFSEPRIGAELTRCDKLGPLSAVMIHGKAIFTVAAPIRPIQLFTDVFNIHGKILTA